MVNIILTGLNGYGGHFIEPLINNGHGDYKLVAVVSGNPGKSQYYDMLINNDVHFYSDLQECIDNEAVDVAILTTPMHIHYKEVMCALDAGISVYCEKPLACTLKQCRELEAFAKEKGCLLAVGYQWSYSDAILSLKVDLLKHRFGKVISAKTKVKWNRPKTYYSESNWKGKIFDKEGNRINESVMSNCAAHFLHNILFLTGSEINKAAMPENMKFECYRAHNIESFDTVSFSAEAETGGKLYYIATTVADNVTAPEFEIECENAVIRYPFADDDGKNVITAQLRDGSTKVYGCPDDRRFEHFEELVHAIVKDEMLVCDASTVIPFATVIDTVSEVPVIVDFDRKLVTTAQDKIEVKGLSELIDRCYDNLCMISEAKA